MTRNSVIIDNLVSYDWTDWEVTSSEMRRVISILRSDGDIDRTLTDLHSSGGLARTLERVNDQAMLRELVAVLAVRSSSSASTVRTAIRLAMRSNFAFGNVEHWSGFDGSAFFDVCADLGRQAAAHLFASRSGRPVSPAPPPSDDAAPFGGVGATGVNPTTHTIGYVDQAFLALGHEATRAEYSNPIPGSLSAYIRGLTPTQRVGQARTLIRQPISTVFPHVYLAPLPLRSQVMHAAGAVHNLQPELIAAIILAEQRDQSRNEDAVDIEGALSRVVEQNTSIGLGQVVVTTAQRHDLFGDLLPSVIRSSLSRRQIVRLLASDEFNIFATARYIRIVADDAARLGPGAIPRTRATFSGLDLRAYANHSSTWPLDNVRALASEYTSRPWDDRLSTGWAWFVAQGFNTIRTSGIPFP